MWHIGICSKWRQTMLLRNRTRDEWGELTEDDSPWEEGEYPEDDYGDFVYPAPIEKRIFRKRKCTKCGKEFSSSNQSALCFECTLKDHCNGNPPEEGDFNTAGILSGTISNVALAELHDYV